MSKQMSGRAAVCLAASLFTITTTLAGAAAPEVGEPASFSFRSVDGKQITLAQFKGKIVVVDFWATWCGPCMGEAPHMVSVNEQYKDKGLQFIGISLDSDRQKMLDVAKSSGFTWPQYFDGKAWKNDLAVNWGIDSIPRTFVFDPSGKLAWTGHPANLDRALEKAFKETPPQMVDPAVLTAATSTLDAVMASLEKDPAAAIAKFANVPADASKDAAFAERLAAASTKVEAAAQAMIDDAGKLVEAKQYNDAAAKLQVVADGMPQTSASGTAARKKLADLLKMPEVKAEQERVAKAARDAERATKADAALVVAKQYQADKKDEQAYAAFRAITKQYADTPAAKPAADAVAAYETDPVFMRKARDAEAGTRAKGMLSLAENYRANNKPDLARQKYQQIIAQFPDTSFAETAQTEMSALK